jgi:hypothetical protein
MSILILIGFLLRFSFSDLLSAIYSDLSYNLFSKRIDIIGSLNLPGSRNHLECLQHSSCDQSYKNRITNNARNLMPTGMLKVYMYKIAISTNSY